MLYYNKSINVCKFIFSLLSKCLHGLDETVSQATFDPWAAVWKHLVELIVYFLCIFLFCNILSI